jgi:hypothetical protein
MIMQVTNLDRVPTPERAAIRRRADAIRAGRVSG